MPAARRRHCCIWKKTDRERERERGSASVFGRRERSRRSAAEGCIIKSIHSGLPNRSILIREPFSGTARREKNSPFRPSPYSRRCKFLSTLSPPSHRGYRTEKTTRQLSCGFRLALWRRGKGRDTSTPNTTGKEEWNRQPNHAPFDKIDPKF